MADQSLHVAMYPWLAIGHITPFLHISNKLAEKGHKISFFIPTNTQSKVQHLNLHPHLLSFIPINLPHVDGLPLGSETTNDLPFALYSHLMTAMDLTQPAIEAYLRDLKPHFIFYDFTHWMPSLARSLGIKPFHFCTVSPATIGYLLCERKLNEQTVTEADYLDPPPGFPSSAIRLRPHEARRLANTIEMEFGKGVPYKLRRLIAFADSDGIVIKTCKEIEGSYCDYLATQMKKQVLLAGPVLPKPPTLSLEERWANWLGNFKPKSVVYCALGTECALSKDQFQELVLGLELTGMPFLAALRPPIGAETIESALPEGFKERTKGRGVVYGGFVQQQLILNHPSVGAFVTHCGLGSLTEGMVSVSECQLVLLPYYGDQFFNARIMGGDLKVGIEIGRDEQDGRFTKEGVCKVVRDAMEEGSKVGQEIRSNHAKWRKFLCSEGLENSYVDALDQELHDMLDS